MKDICTSSFLNDPWKDIYPGGKSNPDALCKHGHKSAEIVKRVQKQLHADEATNGLTDFDSCSHTSNTVEIFSVRWSNFQWPHVQSKVPVESWFVNLRLVTTIHCSHTNSRKLSAVSTPPLYQRDHPLSQTMAFLWFLLYSLSICSPTLLLMQIEPLHNCNTLHLPQAVETRPIWWSNQEL